MILLSQPLLQNLPTGDSSGSIGPARAYVEERQSRVQHPSPFSDAASTLKHLKNSLMGTTLPGLLQLSPRHADRARLRASRPNFMDIAYTPRYPPTGPPTQHAIDQSQNSQPNFDPLGV